MEWMRECTCLLLALFTTTVNAATVVPWGMAICLSQEGLYNAVGLTEVSSRTNNHAERIANVMTTIGFVQERRTGAASKSVDGGLQTN